MQFKFDHAGNPVIVKNLTPVSYLVSSIPVIPPDPAKVYADVYTSDNQFLCYANEGMLISLMQQIRHLKLKGYYFMYDKERFDISDNGTCALHPELFPICFPILKTMGEDLLTKKQ